MEDIKYNLASSTWDDKELAAIQRVIDSGNYSMGKEVTNFEQEFAKFTGSKHCVMVNSGSSANLIMIAALFYCKENQLKAGDEVIVPAVSWPTTYYPLAQYGLKLKFVDIDKHTLNYDLDALKSAVSDKARLLMVVNLLGNPNDFAQINEIIANKNIRLIEDNCESMGALFQEKQAGTFGVMGSFSTFFSHHMATMEGGMVVTDDEKSDDPFEESFRFVLPGYNVRPIEMEAAVGVEQLKKLPEFIQERRSNAQHFQELFADHPDFYIQQEIGKSSWFGFALVIKESSKLNRRELAKKLMNAGIECRPIVAGNFAKNEVMKYFNYEIHGELTNAELIDRNGLFVGNHQIDIREQIGYLLKSI
jgi:CDP-6-deoxy-D-xylo-4-hexulose-3-dehydrase